MSCNYDETLLNEYKITIYNKDQEDQINIAGNSLIPLQDQFEKIHIIKVCYKIDYFMNFVYLNQQQQQQQQQQQKNISSYDCQYNGLSFQLNQKTQKCPISDIKFSKEKNIENYEKMPIEFKDNFSFFIKRNDSNSTPLVGLFLQKDEFYGLRKTDLTFDSVSLCKFDQYTLLCEQNQLELAQYSLQLENQIPYTPFCSFNYEEFNQNSNYFVAIAFIGLVFCFLSPIQIFALDWKDQYPFGFASIIYMIIHEYCAYNTLSSCLNSIGWSCLLESPLKSELQWIDSYVSYFEIKIAFSFCFLVACFVAIKLIKKA
ncbi:transmembrane protein, putative (macronuclear) [Tetrahymena thermophila SB210]|uniref:Transmembrane protein, putative n=1 Tax=Tetrahymena thermophila (strain SB210) TaxID=312017 RepID=I7MMN3_TETTS|nr:transmembrane protein, putative [Tetrahymena thermophila SB210]EAS06085.1 transmembrane protein, putative [Tetrahymena thermophila SB210]|eukprot:XP_001026330.1 transmembrane protein, putative [Tetrahymena thermophila SB210]